MLEVLGLDYIIGNANVTGTKASRCYMGFIGPMRPAANMVAMRASVGMITCLNRRWDTRSAMLGSGIDAAPPREIVI